MSLKDELFDALKKGNRTKAFDVFMNRMSFHAFLNKCHLTMLTPHVPHKIYLYGEVIAYKTKDGGRVYLSINLDWIRQELTVNIQYGYLKFVTSLPLEMKGGTAKK